MDPLSITAGVLGVLQIVTKLGSTLSHYKDDYKLADSDLNAARDHALLLKEEIRGLESRGSQNFSPLRKSGHDETDSSGIDSSSFNAAVAAARSLLLEIESTFPLRSEPHTWRSKVRWAMKDKEAFAKLQSKLRSAESTLQGVLAMEQLRISRMVYGMLLQQKPTMDKLERGELLGQNVINMAVVNQSAPDSAGSPPTYLEAKLSALDLNDSKSIQARRSKLATHATMVTKPTKMLPKTTRFDQWGFTAQLMTLPQTQGTRYTAAMHISLFAKMYSIQLQATPLSFAFDRAMHVRNIVPEGSQMVAACRSGDFDTARKLLTGGQAHGSDVTAGGWPMLDYAIESGSSRVVRLLLEHGAEPDLGYGEHNMTALQSAFLRDKLDIARMLINRGADIEHVDSDGFSVLSYLWISDGRLERSAEFMRLCQAHEFSEVNSCDERGWTAFHRAAAVGTSEDVEAFLQLGASLTLRAEWYGWTALFFAVSHDNVETFQTIVKHSGPDVYGILDGDGWTMLHCSIYFGAPGVMRLLLENGIDVNQKTHPAPLPEDPELSYRELTPSEIAIYMGPERTRMFMDALADTGRDFELEGGTDIFWDATSDDGDDKDTHDDGSASEMPNDAVYAAEDFDDKWTLLHWASYNGSAKIKKLLLLKGADPAHLDAIMLEDNPTILATSPFEGR